MKGKATCDMKNNKYSKDLVFIFQLQNFINDNSGDLGSAAEAGSNAVEEARADLEWTKNHRDEILDWLQNKLGENVTDNTSENVTDGSGNIATNTIVITVAFIIALLHNNKIFNYIM